jgi:hypothetical protein
MNSLLFLGGLLAGFSALLYRDRCKRLEEVIRTHDLCHDLDLEVGPEEFAAGCAAHQRKLFGYAPHADCLRAITALSEPPDGGDTPITHQGSPETDDPAFSQEDTRSAAGEPPTGKGSVRKGPLPSKSGKSRRTMHD